MPIDNSATVFTPRFYRVAAICSMVSAATTLLLIFLPYAYTGGSDFDSRMARVNDPAAILRAWAYLIHPFLVVGAALGVAIRLRRLAAGLVLPGFLGFLLWGMSEAGQQAMTLIAFDRWRHAWLVADAATKDALRVQIAVYDGLWDALYFLLLIAFVIGNSFYAIAIARRGRLGRWLAFFYTAAAALTVTIIASELGAPPLPGPLNAVLYPALQPLARILIGVWLWRMADEREPAG
ncbi:hypothetical protein [Tahibacter amnicola]|uniref:Membrane protein DUF2306 n=1 Tax=Tahibacter amnicola TaxID=2976241 RepID=A0ABY6B8K0_9GAMM|nr:hypothetical protein [Tahibacter amnicola]UXI65836.1 hypothetical protein N4264_13795 [Tahibacter amnicola]